MLERSDPEERRQDVENSRANASDPDRARMVMSAPFKIIGDVLRPDSRWANLNPLI
jgi:hypothetical protein